VVFYALFLVRSENAAACPGEGDRVRPRGVIDMQPLILVVALRQEGALAEVARTFGVDWPHLTAQIVSFGIVCAVLYALAYKPLLGMLAARREQIASGLANAEKIRAELNRIEAERRDILARADADARRLIDDARQAAARVQADETARATEAAGQILVRAREAAERERAQMRAELRREIGRLVIHTSAAVTGKVLTPEDHRRLAEGRAARRLVREATEGGVLDDLLALAAVERTARSGRRGSLAILQDFLRLVRLDAARHRAVVASAAPLDADVQADLAAGLARVYGPHLRPTFEVEPALVGGVRITVGSDVYDGSVRGRLAALEARL
jgi:ATP synthase F0 subunit b